MDGPVASDLIRLDLGCGAKKQDGHVGLDRIGFPGVDQVIDLGRKPLPYGNGKVEAIYSAHFLEHLTAAERIHVLNEAWRVLKPGGQMRLIVPHWSTSRAYGDPTHQWPPIGEFFFMYLNKEWRLSQAPHTDVANWPEGYACDFEAHWGYGLNGAPEVSLKSDEAKAFMVAHYKEAAWEIHATLTKR